MALSLPPSLSLSLSLSFSLSLSLSLSTGGGYDWDGPGPYFPTGLRLGNASALFPNSARWDPKDLSQVGLSLSVSVSVSLSVSLSSQARALSLPRRSSLRGRTAGSRRTSTSSVVAAAPSMAKY
eukprot:COSAG03_NODE_777_length_5900_cov_22.520428_7_plen_124_part_00